MEETELRDELARERTILANERTLLAYGRTALGLVALAVFIFKFATPEVAAIFGALTLTCALFVSAWGIHSYRIVDARVQGKTRIARSWGLNALLGRLGLAQKETDI